MGVGNQKEPDPAVSLGWLWVNVMRRDDLRPLQRVAFSPELQPERRVDIGLVMTCCKRSHRFHPCLDHSCPPHLVNTISSFVYEKPRRLQRHKRGLRNVNVGSARKAASSIRQKYPQCSQYPPADNPSRPSANRPFPTPILSPSNLIGPRIH